MVIYFISLLFYPYSATILCSGSSIIKYNDNQWRLYKFNIVHAFKISPKNVFECSDFSICHPSIVTNTNVCLLFFDLEKSFSASTISGAIGVPLTYPRQRQRRDRNIRLPVFVDRVGGRRVKLRRQVVAHVFQTELAAGYAAVGKIVVGRVVLLRWVFGLGAVGPFAAQQQQFPQAHWSPTVPVARAPYTLRLCSDSPVFRKRPVSTLAHADPR